jgi:hypothetical protein
VCDSSDAGVQFSVVSILDTSPSSRPCKPTDNAFIEAFNGRLRAECLNTHWFLSLADAREKLECWRRDYNEVRPHGAIGNKPPAALLECIGVTSPSMSKEAGKSTLR